MAVDERARHELYLQLARVLGEDQGATMMALLPSDGWADVARRPDLDRVEASLRAEMGLRFERLDDRIEAAKTETDLRIDAAKDELLAAFRGELVSAVSSQTRAWIFTMAGSVAALGGLALSLARIG
ncbi:MAG: hypothetical protein H0V05_07045 [Euzebyaceae bacterium]|nr:hypothetical protein [Euzebyaceae bacterium]